jgi:hypothetical protein
MLQLKKIIGMIKGLGAEGEAHLLDAGKHNSILPTNHKADGTEVAIAEGSLITPNTPRPDVSYYQRQIRFNQETM